MKILTYKFIIDGTTIKKKNQQKKPQNKDDFFCSFTFETKEWRHLDKYAIFWSKDGKSTIRYLGDRQKCQCPIPKTLLNDLYFLIQIYANDNVSTHKLKVFTYKKPICKKNNNHDHLDDIKHSQIDNVVYEDNKLLFYSNNKLIKSIDIVDEGLLKKVLTNSAPEFIVDTILSPTSDNPLANKIIYKLLQNKVNKSDLSTVAKTGSYQDLKDIPVEFPPEFHTHPSNDIIDFDESVDRDLDILLDALTEHFKEK